MTTLTDLAELVEGLVDGADSAAATAAVRDAVADFGRRVPRVLRGTIAVVSGTATYALPAGFQRLIRLEGLGEGPAHDASGYLVASFDLAAETYTLSGGTITFYPTPAYTLSRTIRYAAGYPYDEDDDVFAGLAAEHEGIVLLKAQALAHGRLASASVAGQGLSYRIGDVSVQRAVTAPRAELIKSLNDDYLEACRLAAGPVGRRANTALANWSY